MDWLKQNWFKVSILAFASLALILYVSQDTSSGIRIGETKNFGGLDWKMLEYKNIGDELRGKLDIYYNPHPTTTGKFIEVVIQVDNSGNDAAWLPLSRLKFNIMDSEGRIYDEITVGLGRHKWYSKYQEYHVPAGSFEDVSDLGLDEIARNEIKPGIPYRFSAFFEVAEKSSGFRLLIKESQDSKY